jgi:hypothetical protein
VAGVQSRAANRLSATGTTATVGTRSGSSPASVFSRWAGAPQQLVSYPWQILARPLLADDFLSPLNERDKDGRVSKAGMFAGKINIEYPTGI